MTPEQAAAEAYADSLYKNVEDATIQRLGRDCASVGFTAGVAWAREQAFSRLNWTERDWRFDCEHAEERIAKLEAQVANWEREEVRKASCCVHNEERVKQLSAQLADLTGGLSVEEFKQMILKLQEDAK